MVEVVLEEGERAVIIPAHKNRETNKAVIVRNENGEPIIMPFMSDFRKYKIITGRIKEIE